MASLTQWTWVWVDSGSWWWTEKPGVLQFMGSQRVGHNWTTELKAWKQPRCSSTDEWIKLCYIYTMEYYSAIKRNAFESILMRWMNLRPIIGWSKSEREKQMLYVNAYIWNPERQCWWACVQGISGATNTETRPVDPAGEEKRGPNGESRMETLHHPMENR